MKECPQLRPLARPADKPNRAAIMMARVVTDANA
jgi:hypothetical protein